MEVGLEGHIDALLDPLGVVRNGVRGAHPKGVDERDVVDVSVGGDRLEVVEQLRHRCCPGGVDGEERDLEPIVVCVLGGLDRGLDGAFQRPLVGLLDQMVAGGDLHHHAGHATLERQLDVRHQAPAEGVDLGRQAFGGHPLDGLGVGRGYRGETGLDPMDPGLGQCHCDPHLVISGELDTRLLLPVTQRDVVDLHFVRDLEPLGHLG